MTSVRYAYIHCIPNTETVAVVCTGQVVFSGELISCENATESVPGIGRSDEGTRNSTIQALCSGSCGQSVSY